MLFVFKSHFADKLEKKSIIVDKLTAYNYNYRDTNNLKNIMLQWGGFIEWSLNENNEHYSYEIDYPGEDIQNLCMYELFNGSILDIHPISKEDEIILKNSNITYNNFEGFESCQKCECSVWADTIEKLVESDLNCLNIRPWSFNIIKRGYDNVIRIYGLIAIRKSVFEERDISNIINNQLKSTGDWVRSAVKHLDNIDSINECLYYLHEGQQWVFKPHFYTLYRNRYIVEKYFLDVYLNQYNIKNTDKEYYNSEKEEVIFQHWKNLYCGPAIEINVLFESEPTKLVHLNYLEDKNQTPLNKTKYGIKYETSIITIPYKKKSSFCTYKFSFKKVLNKTENGFFKENYHLRKKFSEHTNSVFDKYKLKDGIYEKMDEVVALTNTTKNK